MSSKSFSGSQAGMWGFGMCNHILVMNPTPPCGVWSGCSTLATRDIINIPKGINPNPALSPSHPTQLVMNL